MNDEAIEEVFRAFEPDPASRQRMEGVALAAHALAHRPLSAEWLELLRATPVSGPLLVAAAAIALLVATPLGALLALASHLA